MTAPYAQHELEGMLADLESDLVERKESLRGDNPRKIRQAVCAFANDLPDHRRPGVVFVGADDGGAPVGLEITDELLLQLADVKTDGNIVPPPTLTVDTQVLLGTPVAVVTVMPSDTPPVRHRGRIWIRVGPRRAIASAQDERILNEKRRHRDPHFDAQPVPTASVADLDLRRFEEEYLPLAVDAAALAENDRSTEERLAALKMIAGVDDPRPTIAGILVLGKNPQDFLPAAFAQFLRIAGTDLADPVVDDGRCSGPIAHLVSGLDDKLLAHNRTAVDFTSRPVEVRTPTYPMAALQQLARNAVMHRTYEGTNAPIPGGGDAGPRAGATLRGGHPDGAARPAEQRTAGARLPRRAELGSLYGEGPNVTTPVLTFFNNKSGVGKTSLVYHAAWMLSELDHTVLVVDLDPQANLTAAFLDEDALADLWNDQASASGRTIHQCVASLAQVGDIREPELKRPADRLYLLPGDLALSGFEDLLSTEWPNCLGSTNLYRAFRVVTSFWQVVQRGAEQSGASIVLVDVGPSLGAINRSALIATDFVAVPLAADLFSRQALRNLGPTLRRWRQDWKRRRDNWATPDFALPIGNMQPIGYLIQQHGVRLSRPVQAYDRWVRQMPAEYARMVLDEATPAAAVDPRDDEHCIATVKHYRSLVPLAQDARKPIFLLAAGDGALGSHAAAARDAFGDFRELAEKLLQRTHAASAATEP